MKEIVGKILADEGIDCFGILPAEELTVINPRLMPSWARSAILLVVPYHNGSVYQDGVSAYAHIPDYHGYFTCLFSRIVPKLEEYFPGNRFFGSADHSPIHEKEAAAKAGLGVLGLNSLLINGKYGSYIFLGSVLTDVETNEQSKEIQYCNRCGKCMAACPVEAISENGLDGSRCLSAISQKKKLTAEELLILKNHGIAWGCDRCQEVCPCNREREYTKIPFFRENRHGNFTASEVANMTDEEFLNFAFSWRGRARICENLSNLENLGEQKKNQGFSLDLFE